MRPRSRTSVWTRTCGASRREEEKMAEKNYPKIEDMSFKEASIELEQILSLIHI